MPVIFFFPSAAWLGFSKVQFSMHQKLPVLEVLASYKATCSTSENSRFSSSMFSFRTWAIRCKALSREMGMGSFVSLHASFFDNIKDSKSREHVSVRKFGSKSVCCQDYESLTLFHTLQQQWGINSARSAQSLWLTPNLIHSQKMHTLKIQVVKMKYIFIYYYSSKQGTMNPLARSKDASMCSVNPW